jgi:hypothetical protein
MIEENFTRRNDEVGAYKLKPTTTYRNITARKETKQ